MIPAEKIIVALDTQAPLEYKNLVNELAGFKVWVKIGMELFYSLGPEAVTIAKAHGFNIFLDLKLHDIPNTVCRSLEALCRLPVQMINVHAAGGEQMMKKSAELLSSMPQAPWLIAVTQLTSTTTEQMNREQGIPGTLEESVLKYATLAKNCGLKGVVCSPWEVPRLKSFLGSGFMTVTPGIRPLESAAHDQARFTTPLEALELGTDFMVIGRPITASPDPRNSLENILSSKK